MCLVVKHHAMCSNTGIYINYIQLDILCEFVCWPVHQSSVMVSYCGGYLLPRSKFVWRARPSSLRVRLDSPSGGKLIVPHLPTAYTTR